MINNQILFAGDFAPDTYEEQFIYNGRLNDFWRDLLPIINDSNFSIINLESPLTNATSGIKKTGLAQKAAPQLIQLIKYAGFKAVCLANNHIMDYGILGVQETITACTSNAILTVGAGDNNDYFKPLFTDINKLKICILNYCENEFSSAKLHGHGANPIDIISNFYDIIEAKQKADVVIVILHGGREYHHIPLPSFKRLCEFYIDAGADAIVGHHPHYFSGYSYYKNKPIFYSLGNLYSNSKKSNDPLDVGYLLRLDVKKERLTHEIIGIKKELNSLRLMNQTEQDQLLEQIHSISKIINDKTEHEKYWDSQNSEFDYYFRIFNFRKKWLYKLMKHLPALKRPSPNSYSLTMQNMLQCESHRELLLRTLIKLNGPFENN